MTEWPELSPMIQRKRNRTVVSRRGWIAGALGGTVFAGLSSDTRAAGRETVHYAASIGTPTRPGELRSLRAPKSDERLVAALGFWTPGDGGGGLFEWSTGRGKEDGGTAIVPASSDGYWRRIFTTSIDVRWFGARGVGNDDHDAIQQAILASAGRAVCRVPCGTYVVGQLKLPSRTTLIGEDRTNTVLRLRPGNYAPGPDGDGGAMLGNADMVRGNRHIHIRGLTLDGDHRHSTGGCHAVELKAAKGGRVEDCSVEDCVMTRIPHREDKPFVAGHGIRLWNASRCHIRCCHFEDNLGDGINVYFGSSDIVIESCVFRKNAFLGIDCEGRSGIDWTSARNRNIAIRNNSFAENQAAAVGIYATDIWQVTGNSILDGGSGGTQNGITIIGASAGTVAANTIAELKGAAVHVGVDHPTLHGVAGTGCSEIVVSGNAFSRCRVGVRLFTAPGSPVRDVAVNGNVVSRIGESALALDGKCERVIFDGNVVLTTGDAAIRAEATVQELSISSSSFHGIRGETLATSGDVKPLLIGNVGQRPRPFKARKRGGRRAPR